jgi:hypothetical protein
MKADSFDLSREQVVSLIEKYTEMGGGLHCHNVPVKVETNVLQGK